MDKLISTDLPYSEMREEPHHKRPNLVIRQIKVEKVQQEFQFDSELETPVSNMASSQRSFVRENSSPFKKEKTSMELIGKPSDKFSKRSPKKFAKSLIYSNTKIGSNVDPSNLLNQFVWLCFNTRKALCGKISSTFICFLWML